MTPLEQRVMALLEEHRGDYNQVAKDTHIKAEEIRKIDIRLNKKFNFTPSGDGRNDLKKYMIAKTRTHQEWDNTDPKIKKARQDFDDGKIEMCTGRDGLYLILYAIPRKVVKMNNKPYFTELEQEND